VLWGFLMCIVFSLFSCYVWGIHEAGSNERRPIIAASFHVLVHMLQCCLWFTFTEGGGWPRSAWWSYLLLGAISRGGTRWWCVATGHTNSLLSEDPKEIMSRPSQYNAYLVFYTVVLFIQGIIPGLFCAPRSAGYTSRERLARELLKYARSRTRDGQDPLDAIIGLVNDKVGSSSIVERTRVLRFASSSMNLLSRSLSSSLMLRRAPSALYSSHPTTRAPRMRRKDATVRATMLTRLLARAEALVAAPHRGGLLPYLCCGHDDEPSETHLSSVFPLRQRLAFSPSSAFASSVDMVFDPQEPFFPVWSAWCCCGSVITPSEAGLLYLVSNGMTPPKGHISGGLCCRKRRVAPVPLESSLPSPSQKGGSPARRVAWDMGGSPARSVPKREPSARDSSVAAHVADVWSRTILVRCRHSGDWCFCLTPLCTHKVCRVRTDEEGQWSWRNACYCLFHRRSGAWPPGVMTLMGWAVGFSGPFIPILRIMLSIDDPVSFASAIYVVLFSTAIFSNSFRRDPSRRRLDGGTLLGAMLFIEAIIGGASLLVLQALQGGNDSRGLAFFLTTQAYLFLISLMLSVWERASMTVARDIVDRQGFIFVLEVMVATFTVLAFALAMNIASLVFWASLLTKGTGMVLLPTHSHRDWQYHLRFGRTWYRFPTAQAGRARVEAAHRSMLAEQIASVAALACIGVEQFLLATGLATTSTLMGGETRGTTPLAASASALVLFLVFRFVSVPLTMRILRRKMARTRWRWALHAVLGAVLIARRFKLGKRKPVLEDLSDTEDISSVSTDSFTSAGMDDSKRTVHGDVTVEAEWGTTDKALNNRWWEIFVFVSFAISSVVPGIFFSRARLRDST
jgi:hypothetical protein